MPSAKPPVKGAPTKPGVKGKPLGIPMWGWFAAAAVGILIGYTLLRKTSAMNAGVNSPDSSLSPSNESGGNSPGGSIALPADLLQALGLRPSGGGAASNTGGESPGGGESASAAPSEATQVAIDSGFVPGQLILQGSGPLLGPGGIATSDPEHNQFLAGQTDVDPFHIGEPSQSLDPAIQTAIQAKQQAGVNSASPVASNLSSGSPYVAPSSPPPTPAPASPYTSYQLRSVL